MAGRGTDIKLDKAAIAAGGLHVIATEHQESERVDRQLIGRAARQGQPGTCQFYVSAEDELFVKYGEGLAKRIAKSCHKTGESRKDWSRDIRRIQVEAENETFDRRKDLFKHDTWTNDVLTTVAERNKLAKRKAKRAG